MVIVYNNRQINIEFTEVINKSDDWWDAYINNAYYIDTEIKLTNKEIDDLQENGNMEKWTHDWLS